MNAVPTRYLLSPLGTGLAVYVRACLIVCALACVLAAPAFAARSANDTPEGRVSWLFESGPVRPLALSPDGERLFVANIPDGHLEIFDLVLDAEGKGGGLRHAHSVPVGLEPVSVAARDDGTVWVVNHLSDSISIVDANAQPPRVVRTLMVGDEPRDLVFAGPDRRRALVTTAHRGQHSPYPTGEHALAGIGRADVWVFDVDALGEAPGGKPETILTLFGDTPRALAVSPDGNTVHAAIFHSGNRTTAIHELSVCKGGAEAAPCEYEGIPAPGGLPAPNTDKQGVPGPEVGLMVKFDRADGKWKDELGRDWSAHVFFDLPDYDVFAIDVSGAEPVVREERYTDVGTTLFNMVANPVTGALYVSNTESKNRVRFEGPGEYAAGFKPEGEPATVRGHLAESRITVLRDGVATPRHLNPHIPYGANPVPPGVKEASLATPVDMAVSADGATLYVAAFGSAKVGVLETKTLEAGTFAPSAEQHIELPGGGPSGLALDEARARLYVLTRFDNAVVSIDTERREVLQRLPLHNPEPSEVIEGRRFHYDARRTSSNGETSCASCHIFGDWDGLAWDLGNPDDSVAKNRNKVVPGLNATLQDFHPMKGPMSTQTMRGLAHHGPQHWRGDRPGNAEAAFKAFNVAFGGLVGRDEGGLSPRELQAFADFALQLTMPPNPGRRLDNQLRFGEALGLKVYQEKPVFFTPGGLKRCNDCHVLAPRRGLFGTGTASSPSGGQALKIPQLRNIYQKVGASGTLGVTQHTGPQIRSTGLGHGGFLGSTLEFFRSRLFQLTLPEEHQMAALIAVYPSTLAPVVGQQETRASAASAERVALLHERAGTAFVLRRAPQARECDLVVKGAVDGALRGWLRLEDGRFQPDREGEAPVALAALEALSERPGQPLTFTCAPPGSGKRMALDRDGDGVWDGDERAAGSDPANRASFPGVCRDGIDNDGDGRADADDPGCAGPTGLAENPHCSDGIDNDGDGVLDHLADAGCASASGDSEIGTRAAGSFPLLPAMLAIAVVIGAVGVWGARGVRRGRG